MKTGSIFYSHKLEKPQPKMNTNELVYYETNFDLHSMVGRDDELKTESFFYWHTIEKKPKWKQICLFIMRQISIEMLQCGWKRWWQIEN